MDPQGRRIRILNIITRMEFGGSPLNLLDMMSRLDRRRFDLFLATGLSLDPEEDLSEEAREMDVEVLAVPSLIRDVRPFSDLRALWQLLKIIKRGDYDIVHCHTSKAGFLGPLAARIAGAKAVLYSPHGSILYGYFGALKTRFFVLLQKAGSRFTDKTICLSQDEIRQYLGAKIGLPEQYTYIYNGIDIQGFARKRVAARSARKRLMLESDDFIGISVGRLVPVKGYRNLIEAIGLVKRDIPRIRLVIAGEGSEREALEEQVQTESLQKNVFFLGLRRDIPEILSCGDVFLLSSLNEGFGLVLLEAMAMRLPIVATRVGGIPEVVVDGDTGFLVDPGNPTAMADALLKIYQDPRLANELGIAGYKRAKSLFDIRLMTRKYEQLYAETVLNSSGWAGSSAEGGRLFADDKAEALFPWRERLRRSE
jgi:glycosyltransferase involved in cell wall biosynthesis